MRTYAGRKNSLKAAITAAAFLAMTLMPLSVFADAGEKEMDPVYIRVTLHEAEPEGAPVQVGAHLSRHVWRGAQHRFGLCRSGEVIPFPSSQHRNMEWGELDQPEQMLEAGQSTEWADITDMIRGEHDWYRFNFAFNTLETTARDEMEDAGRWYNGDVFHRRFDGNLDAVAATIDFATGPSEDQIKHSLSYRSDDYSVVPLLVRDMQEPRLEDFSIITNYDYVQGFVDILAQAGITSSMQPERFPITDNFTTDVGSGLRFDSKTAKQAALYLQRSGVNFPSLPDRYLESYREKGMFPEFDPVPTKVRDEPSIPTPDRIAEDEERLQRFRSWLEAEGINPSELGFDSYDEVVPITYDEIEKADNEEQAKKLHWYSVWSGQIQSLEDLREQAEDRRANSEHPIETNMSVYYGGFSRQPCYFLESRMGAMDRQNHHYGYGWHGMTRKRTHMNILMAAIFRSAAKFGDIETGVLNFNNRMAHSEHGSAESGIRLSIYTALIHGMQSIYHYRWGPRYTGWNGFVNDRGETAKTKMVAVAETMGELAQIEDYLLDGTSPQEEAQVAMLHGRGTEIWGEGARRSYSVVNKGYGGILTERRMVATALALHQVPFDIVPEEVLAEHLDNYSVLYVVDPWVLQDTQDAIVDWVKNGGTLFTTGKAGMYDQFDRETNLLGRLAGDQAEFETEATGENYTEEHHFAGNIGALESLGTAQWKDIGERPFSSDLFAVRQQISVPGARVLARCKESGEAIAVEFDHGSGRVVHIGTHLGAVLARATEPGFAERTVYYHRVFDADLYGVYLYPLRRAGVERRLVLSEPGFDANFYETDEGAVVLMADYHTADVRTIDVEAYFSRDYASARTLDGKEVKLHNRDGRTVMEGVEVPITQVLLLEP